MGFPHTSGLTLHVASLGLGKIQNKTTPMAPPELVSVEIIRMAEWKQEKCKHVSHTLAHMYAHIHSCTYTPSNHGCWSWVQTERREMGAR